MIQIDYEKWRLQVSNGLNLDFLTPHPTIKDRYKMDFPVGGFYGKTLFGNNIDLYLKNETLYLSCSLPYLVHGHNFTSFLPGEAEKVVNYISSLLSVDLMQATVVDYEVGQIFKLNSCFKSFQQQITGVDGMELQKKQSSCVIYGKGKRQFKLYDISKNLRRKIDDSVRKTFPWTEAGDCIKCEFKFIKDNQYTVKTFLNDGFYRAVQQLSNFIEDNIHFSQSNYSGDKFDDILFQTLIKLNEYAPKDVQEMVMDEINASSLSPAKKTMRRKAFLKKQSQATCGKQKKFADFLDKSVHPNIKLGTFPKDNCLISKNYNYA